MSCIAGRASINACSAIGRWALPISPALPIFSKASSASTNNCASGNSMARSAMELSAKCGAEDRGQKRRAPDGMPPPDTACRVSLVNFGLAILSDRLSLTLASGERTHRAQRTYGTQHISWHTSHTRSSATKMAGPIPSTASSPRAFPPMPKRSTRRGAPPPNSASPDRPKASSTRTRAASGTANFPAATIARRRTSRTDA